MNRKLYTANALFVAATLLVATAAAPRPQHETLHISGLQQPVEIIKDRWGISHIYAKTEEDLFFAQGFNAARDRLFQLEIWRRQAHGLVAEMLGSRELRRDIGTRLFRFRGDPLVRKHGTYWEHQLSVLVAPRLDARQRSGRRAVSTDPRASESGVGPGCVARGGCQIPRSC